MPDQDHLPSLNDPGRSTRREFVQGTAAVVGAAAAQSLLPLSASAAVPAKDATTSPAPAKRPNIVFFYNEGQRADALSLAGHPLLQTPHMDRIGREGVYFNNSFCTNALCAPARAVALTGLQSHSSGALDNSTRNPLPADIPLITDLLHAAGYDVAMVGKAHLPNGARERYWDYYFAFNAAATNAYAPVVYEGRAGKIGAEKLTFDGAYADDLFTDRALAWLAEPRDRPFCLLLWQQAPHSPYYRPRRYLNKYNGVAIPEPATFNADLEGYPGKPRAFVDALNKIGTTVSGDAVRCLEELVKNYYVGLNMVDDNIGRVLAHLEATKQLDDTAVVLSSDHGYFLGEWCFFDKRFMHEPSLRVPLMVRYPPAFRAGVKVDEMVLNLDLAPTLLELAGVPIPKSMQGKSLVKLAQSGEPVWRKDWLYEYFDYPVGEKVRPHRGVRSERYKYIHYFAEPQEFELYDLQDDPGELHNLYGDPLHKPLQETMAARLQALRKEANDHTIDNLVQPSALG